MKKILLICFALLISGCTTEVNLVINEDNVSETIKIYGLKNEVYLNDTLEVKVKNDIEDFEREYEFYDVREFEDEIYVGKTYELSENPKLWAELSHLRACYEKFELNQTATELSLITSDEYRCGYLFGANDVTLVIESDLDIISSNADDTKGNKLIWNINKDNYKDKSISFNYKIDDSKNEILDSQYLVYLIVIILIVGILFFIRKKNKENNKI